MRKIRHARLRKQQRREHIDFIHPVELSRVDPFFESLVARDTSVVDQNVDFERGAVFAEVVLCGGDDGRDGFGGIGQVGADVFAFDAVLGA